MPLASNQVHTCRDISPPGAGHCATVLGARKRLDCCVHIRDMRHHVGVAVGAILALEAEEGAGVCYHLDELMVGERVCGCVTLTLKAAQLRSCGSARPEVAKMTLVQARSFRTDEFNASKVEEQRCNRLSSLQAQDEIDVHEAPACGTS